MRPMQIQSKRAKFNPTDFVLLNTLDMIHLLIFYFPMSFSYIIFFSFNSQALFAESSEKVIFAGLVMP
jgi:hypothetical protein